jgi:hypothetical protein
LALRPPRQQRLQLAEPLAARRPFGAAPDAGIFSDCAPSPPAASSARLIKPAQAQGKFVLMIECFDGIKVVQLTAKRECRKICLSLMDAQLRA